MRAVVVHGAGDLRVEDRPEPVAGPGEVVLDLEWGGIGGSDLSYWRRGAAGTSVLHEPLVLGHEVAGRVATLGDGVRGLAVGQAVTVHRATLVGDAVLPDRLAGRTNLHPEVRYLGSAALVPHTDGGFRERMAIPAAQVRPLPAGVDTRSGALAEPLAVALHAVARAGSLAGRDVLVNGAGPIGALVVAAARRAGARSVLVADVDPAALRVALAMGADEGLHVSGGDDLPTDVEIAFEASSAPSALGPVLASVARGGTLVQVGNLPGAPSPVALGQLVTREITWIGSYRFVEEITDALRAMADGLDVTPLVTHTVDLADAVTALRTAADPASGCSKVMLRLG